MKKLVLCLALGALAGCAATNSVTAPEQQKPATVYHALQTLNYQPLRIYDEAVQQIVKLTDRAEVLSQSGSESSVIGWKIPAYGVYRFKIISQIERAMFGREASAFMAEVQLLDKDYQVVRVLPAGQLSYQKPGLLTQEFLYHSFVVDNRDPLLTPVEYIVVNMTDKGRQNTIQVMDHEKEYAKARGILPPATDDIMATAAESGIIILEAMTLTTAYTSSAAPKPAYMPPVVTGEGVVISAQRIAQDDTVDLSRKYQKEVRTLLDNGDVSGVLRMRQNVKTLDGDMQTLFATLYGKANGSMTGAISVMAGDDIEDQLADSYKQQLTAYLQQGNTQSALGLIDQVRSLAGHVDALFR